MYQERILLTVNDILEKEFKIDTRGYRPQEVDKFLDIIIRDYEEMNSIIKALEKEKKAKEKEAAKVEKEKKELMEDNLRLKHDVRNLRTKLEVIRDEGGDKVIPSNADVLRRLSNLEKIIYGKE